uniref:Cytochrome P450 n=1 Tax=Polyporus umbellatus TaxID=158314 RepID=A0A160HKU3_9APHY|nr:cytochrome P450 [Polyporus umbellatus]
MSDSGETWQFLIALAALYCVVIYTVRRRRNPLHSIPTIGPSAPLVSYLGAIRYIRNAEGMLWQGYRKYYGSIFKVSMLDGWLVVLSGPRLIDELRRISDDQLSSVEGVAEVLQLRHTLDPSFDDQFHVPVVRDKLARNLAAVYPDVLDEIFVAFQEYIPYRNDSEWVSVHMYPIVQKVMARASNRIFVGLPHCRDPKYLDVTVNFTNDVFISSFIINRFPDFIKPLIGRMLPATTKSKKILRPILLPMLKERLAAMDSKKGEDKPRDMLQWLLEEGRSKGTPLDSIVDKVLLVNFGAIHTSTVTFTHALYNLATYTHHIEPLRDEIESIIKEEGWSTGSLKKMRKLDSFLKESMRLADGSLLNMFRKAMKDVTLSDGTRIPKGTLVAASAVVAHSDDTRYADPTVFDPFRFARMREGDIEESDKHQLVNTSVDFITFGHGKHACPGRFFAANALKTMMAYLVLNYDVRFEEEGKRPANIRIGPSNLPSESAQVLFRKRRVEGQTLESCGDWTRPARVLY